MFKHLHWQLRVYNATHFSRKNKIYFKNTVFEFGADYNAIIGSMWPFPCFLASAILVPTVCYFLFYVKFIFEKKIEFSKSAMWDEYLGGSDCLCDWDKNG